MKKIYSLNLLLLCVVHVTIAQTGPGGVGSSANNVLWMDANKGVTVSGSAVTQWDDQSGNARIATPNANTNRPTLVNNSVNGYPSIDFDGSDDELRIPDNNSLDLTQWTIFIVLTADLLKNYNAWMVKGDDGQENYEMLSYSDGNIHAPVYWTNATRTFPSAAAGQVVVGTFDIFEYSYISSAGRDIYKNNGTAIITDNESTTPQTNGMPIYIGNEKTTSRYVDGDIAEIAIYNAKINTAQKIIVNNYLAAKYNRTLTNDDIYVQDNGANGNYDHDVAGIGREDASNIQNDSQGSGKVRIRNPNGLGDNEYLIWGHDGGINYANNFIDVPATVQARLGRVWRVNEVSKANAAVDVGSVDVRWDLNNMGAVTVSDLRFIVDTDNDGIFSDETPISGATSLGGGIYEFAGITAIANNLRFTLGTINKVATPLPIELVSFDAHIAGASTVQLDWVTASEMNNDFFSIERSTDGSEWNVIETIKGKGNSNQEIKYTTFDKKPFEGLQYYRLKQTDFDGQFTYSSIKPIKFSTADDLQILLRPNPASNTVTALIEGINADNVSIRICDLLGQVVFEKSFVGMNTIPLDVSTFKNGMYIADVVVNTGLARRLKLVKD